MSALDLLVLSIAVWFTSHLLTHELGPFSILARIRVSISVLQCIYCTAFWVAIILYAIYVYWTPIPAHVLAVGGAALMLRSYTGAGIHDV